MAITGTTLAAAILATDNRISVTAATGFATSTTAPQWVKIDQEYMYIDPAYNAAPFNATGTTIPVYRRGSQNSAVVAHNILAPVTTGLFSELPNPGAGTDSLGSQVNFGIWQAIVEYGASGAITVPTVNTMVVLSKAGVAAMTLAAPSKGTDGVMLFVTSNVAQAHTITATSLIADGASGSPHTTITFTTGYKGQGIVLVAYQGLWQVFSNIATTIT